VCCSGAPAGACAPPCAPVPALTPGSKTCGTAPGRDAAGCCGICGFSSSFPRVPNPGGARPCQGGTHCVQWGGRWRPALTWPRRDYIALLEEEEKRRSNGQRCVSAARDRPQLRLPRRQGGRSGEGARARSRCPRGTQPGSKRPIERHSAAAWQGFGGAEPPKGAPAHASPARRERARAARAVSALGLMTRRNTPRQTRARLRCAPRVFDHAFAGACACRLY
jgi:hypothetical protein